MDFVEKHLTRHQLLHKPHRWFLAFLLSPTHAAEQHYKKRYHLTFRHAKKLFIFDLLLLTSMIVLVGGSIFWFLYDPTVRDLVFLTMSSSGERIQSGEKITYTFAYSNRSDVTLEDVTLALTVPAGFIVESTTLPEAFSPQQSLFSLKNLPTGAHGKLSLTGYFYALPDSDTPIEAHLSYKQEGRPHTEVRVRKSIAILRGSVLKSIVRVPSSILGSGETPISIEITNEGDLPLREVSVPLPQGNLNIQNATTTQGSISNAVWHIPTLTTGEKAILTGKLVSRLAAQEKRAVLSVTPSITIGNTRIDQHVQRQAVAVLHPGAILTTSWNTKTLTISPGSATTLDVTVTNTGDSTLENLSLSLPVPENIVNLTLLRQENIGAFEAGLLTVTARQLPALSSLEPGQTKSFSFPIPIRPTPSGTDLLLSLTPTLTAQVKGLEKEHLYQTSGSTPEIRIGTKLLLEAEVRYYTDEGDQLGRGPLPPQVGKETKYWALIRITNTTSRVRNLTFAAELPPFIVWTGRTSVSHGDDALFDPAERLVRWQLPELPANQTVGIHLELSFTPSEEHRGTTPLLLKNIRVAGKDTFIDTPLSRTHADLNTALTHDSRATEKGVLVQ